nr:MAG TPA: hypothetical protein [Caudoviricetes sp.]
MAGTEKNTDISGNKKASYQQWREAFVALKHRHNVVK